MTAQPTTERRRFGMHANLLYDVITKQAGTLQKAILEGVMNGVDAGATRIEVTLDADRLTIVDDGKGFAGREEIEGFFETFGTPHQEGDATYGRFRMGRGQLFSFGRNTWRTNAFRMEVDIKCDGLDYDLQTLDEIAPGCSICVDLYDKLLPSARDATEREIKKWVAWVSIPVVFNGKTISQDPAEAKWTVETDDAWFKLSSTANSLTVYNLGVQVMEHGAYHYGVGGVVVSKQRVDVNFARNDIQSNCPVFRRIKAELRKHSDKETTSKRKLTDAERQHLALRIASCDIGWKEGQSAPVLTDIEGKHYSLEKLRTKLYTSHDLVAGTRGDRMAIKVAQLGMAIVLSEETLQRFGVEDVQGLIDAIVKFAEESNVRAGSSDWSARYFAQEVARMRARTLDDYRHLVDVTYETIEPKTLSQIRKIHMAACAKGGQVIAKELGKPGRRFLAGRSQIARAWTDGTSLVWIDVEQLALLSDGYQGATKMAALILHEFMHDGPDTETHEHDVEFYERFHDVALDKDAIGKAAAAMSRHLADQARRLGLKPNNKVLLFEDTEEQLVRAGANGSTQVPDEKHDEERGSEVRRAA